MTIIDTFRLKQRLAGQRWFAGRGRTIERIVVLDEATLDDGPPALVLALLEVHLDGGDAPTYHVPLLVDEDGGAVDAFDDVERLQVVGDLMAHGHVIKGLEGAFYFGGAGLDPGAPPGARSIRSIGSEQSNTSAVFDEEVIVKFFRRVEPGPNPELELNRLLTNEGFEFIARQVGEISYEGQLAGDEVEINLGIAQQYVAGAIDGWTDALGHVHRLFDAIPREEEVADIPALVEPRSAVVLGNLERLGDDTASLHVCLSREEMEPDIAPEPITEHDLEEWAGGARRSFRALVEGGASELEELEDGLFARIDDFCALTGELGSKIRIHGDYHLGQVLLSKREWMIIDFEGEPARPMEVRRTKQSALRDVAGMLRSFGYASLVPVLEREGVSDAERAALEPRAAAWEELARTRFLHGYLRTSHEGTFLPAERHDLDVMLDFFEIEKALYEMGYERAHRPHWAHIPLEGLRRLLRQGER